MKIRRGPLGPRLIFNFSEGHDFHNTWQRGGEINFVQIRRVKQIETSVWDIYPNYLQVIRGDLFLKIGFSRSTIFFWSLLFLKIGLSRSIIFFYSLLFLKIGLSRGIIWVSIGNPISLFFLSIWVYHKILLILVDG